MSRVKVDLAGGGDEKVSPASVLYFRRPTPSEMQREPAARTVLRLSGPSLFTIGDMDQLAGEFGSQITLAAVTLPNRTQALVNTAAVVDSDPPGSSYPTSAKTVLVFGVGPGARRLAVREEPAELESAWAALGASTTAFA
ncbi:MAG: hypothetical protein AAF638_08215 [Pseudomonadota bacterium]